MGLRGRKSIASRFMKYVQSLVEVIGHADRAGPLQDYCTGLAAASGRKSVEPMAAITAPERTAAQHQSLLHFVGQGAWSDDVVLAKVREMVLPEIERHGAIKAWGGIAYGNSRIYGGLHGPWVPPCGGPIIRRREPARNSCRDQPARRDRLLASHDARARRPRTRPEKANSGRWF
jgi:DDE superfamily endonuclease